MPVVAPIVVLGGGRRAIIPKSRAEWRILLSAMIALALWLPSILVLSASYLPEMTDTAVWESSTAAKTLALTIHNPIDINGNGGFTNASGVVWGSGTAEDPFLIEGWDISASTVNAIEISNTDAHFIVRDCYVHGGGSLHVGIVLSNCVNGRLDGNNCSNNICGIEILYSSTNTLGNNNCSSNDLDGVYFGHCDNNTLSNNNCSSNNGWGMCIVFSNNNSLDGNTCNSNERGIALVLSSDSILNSNICNSNRLAGMEIQGSNNNSLRGNTCSSNGYSGIYLYDSSHNNTLSSNTCHSNIIGGIWLDSSSNNTLGDNNCSNNGRGIYLSYSSNNTLSNNNCSSSNSGISLSYSSNSNTLANNTCNSNTALGIRLDLSHSNTLANNTCSLNVAMGVDLNSSDGNTIFWNIIFDNSGYGAEISSGSNNRIWNNTFYHNNGAGDAYDPAHVQARDDGTGNWWNSTDGHGNYWSDWTTPDVVPPYGVVDLPYNIEGGEGAKDFYPLTTPQEPIPEFGAMPLVVMVLLAAILLTIGARRR